MHAVSHQVYEVLFSAGKHQQRLGAVALFGSFPRSVGLALERAGLMNGDRLHFYCEVLEGGVIRVPVRSRAELVLQPAEAAGVEFLEGEGFPVPLLAAEPLWRSRLTVWSWILFQHGLRDLISYWRSMPGG